MTTIGKNRVAVPPTRVLIVDDDPMLRLLAVEALGETEFEVEVAASGLEAVALAVELRPDLILLDVMMPGMDGFETCCVLRAHPALASVPIVMMTGLDDDESINRAYRLGATDFVTKPINYTLLAHRIRYVDRAASAFLSERRNTVRLARAQQLAKMAQWEYDPAEERFQWSAAAEFIYGIAIDQSDVETALMRWVHPEDRPQVIDALEILEPHSIEYRLLLPDLGERVVHQEATGVVDAVTGKTTLVGSAQDITELRAAERQVHALAYYDTLTHLPNRAFARQFLGHVLASAERHSRVVAVLALDIDGFKRVNDMLGHAGGDRLLCEVAERIGACVRGGDSVVRTDIKGFGVSPTGITARFGGDEFVVVLTDLRQAEDAAHVAQRIAERLACSFQIDDAEVFVSSSIGIATFPDHATDVDHLLERADVAMYHAKESGRNRFHFFTRALQERARAQLEMENSLRTMVAHLNHRREGDDNAAAPSPEGTFHLVYQPKVEVPSGAVVGAEALLRWQSPRGMIPPMDFIPLAEDSGLIIPIGEWVLRTACEQAKRWADEGRSLRIAVNVSVRQFREAGFAKMVAGVLAETKLDPALLELEITEGMVMGDTAASQKLLEELKELGIRIALDDFGTGYSSLSYLTRLPIDCLKIDRSFIRALGSGQRGETITAAIIALSRSLGIGVVVEGVETVEQLDFVNRQGNAEIQGFYFAKPMPPVDFDKWCVTHELKYRRRNTVSLVVAPPVASLRPATPRKERPSVVPSSSRGPQSGPPQRFPL